MSQKPDNIFRRNESFDNWLEQSIRDATERGEFSQLKGTGKPQDLGIDHLAGDKESGFRILKNNDLAPAWIEADKEIRKEQEALQQLALKTATFIQEHSARPVEELVTVRPSRWRRIMHGPERKSANESTFSRADLIRERDRVRKRYLERTEALNVKFREYNASLPIDLMWRERVKVTPEQAELAFDTLCPPVD